ARLLLLYPAPYPLAIGRPSRGGDVVGEVAQSLTERKHPQALALAHPVEQGVKLRTERLADWRRDRCEFLRELEECVVQAVPEAGPREERAHALGGAVEAIGQDAADTIGRLLGERRVLEYLVGLGKSYSTGLRGITQVQGGVADRSEFCPAATP